MSPHALTGNEELNFCVTWVIEVENEKNEVKTHAGHIMY